MGEDNNKQPIDYTKMAKAVVDEFMRRIYEEMGKGLLKKIFWILLIGGLGLAVGTGHIPTSIVPPK